MAMKLSSDFALLDVKHGRRQLEKLCRGQKHHRLPEPIDVVITGQLVGQWGNDDGTSIEFEVKVDKVEVQDESNNDKDRKLSKGGDS